MDNNNKFMASSRVTLILGVISGIFGCDIIHLPLYQYSIHFVSNSSYAFSNHLYGILLQSIIILFTTNWPKEYNKENARHNMR